MGTTDESSDPLITAKCIIPWICISWIWITVGVCKCKVCDEPPCLYEWCKENLYYGPQCVEDGGNITNKFKKCCLESLNGSERCMNFCLFIYYSIFGPCELYLLICTGDTCMA